MRVGRDHLLNLVEILLDPLVLVVSLWAVALFINGRLTPQDVLLSLIVFSLTFPGSPRLTMRPWRAIRHIALGWLTLSALLFLFGYASHYLGEYDADVLLTWWWVAFASLAGSHFLLHAAAPMIRELQAPARCVVLAGMNEQGLAMASTAAKSSSTSFVR